MIEKLRSLGVEPDSVVGHPDALRAVGLVGWFMGIPVVADPECPPGKVYVTSPSHWQS